MKLRRIALVAVVFCACAALPSVSLSADRTWTFDDPINYIYDGAAIEVVGGDAQLIHKGDQVTDDTEAAFDAGTYTDTDWVTDHLQLIPDGGPYPASGTYESAVIDSAVSNATWSTITWEGEEVNYGAELPNNEGSDVGANMADNALLLHLDELSGDAIDSSGNGNDCTNSAATYGVAGKFKTAFGFASASSSHLRCGPDASLDFGNEVTTEAWVKPTATAYGYILAKNHYTRYAVFVSATDNQFRTYINGSSYSSNFVFPTDRYTHVASVYDRNAGELKQFVNGQLLNTFNVSAVIDDDGLEIDVGRRCNAVGDCATGQYYFDGDIDELAFYTRALQDTEIEDHYLRGALGIRAQVRSDDDDASWGNFVGPDGTNATYFTDPSASILNVADNRYFQYRFELLSEDSAYTPMFDSVTVDFNYYADDLPDIQPLANDGLTFGRLLTFQETAVKNGGEIHYQLSNDAGTNWLYWDGSAWNTAGATNYNTAANVNTHIQDLPSGDFLFNAFLDSNGSQSVRLEEVAVSSTPQPTGSFNEATQWSDTDSGSELTPEVGDVYISIEVFDSEGNICQASVEYSTDSTTFYPATIGNQTTCDFADALGCPGVDNDATYQIGSVADKGIATAAGSNTIGFIWKDREDITDFYDTVTLRLTVYNPVTLESIPVTYDAVIDNLAPQGLGEIQPINTSPDSIQWSWEIVSQAPNFAKYEVWYGTNSHDVATQSGTAMLWSIDQDPSMSNVDTSTTTIADLDSSTLYFAMIVAVDHFANSDSTDWNAEVSASSSSCTLSLVPVSSSNSFPFSSVLIAFFLIVLIVVRITAARGRRIFKISIWAIAIVSTAIIARTSAAADINYPFDDPANYIYDAQKIDVAGGEAALLLINDATIDDTEADFDAGTYTDTDWITNHLQMIPDGGPYSASGTFESAVIDAGGVRSWDEISWGGEEVDYGKALPDNQGSDTSADMTDDVNLYHFEELSGDAQDSSGNGNAGTVTGATYGANGKFGRALSFDGNDYVQAPDSASLSITGTALTLEIWTYPNVGAGSAALIHKDHHYSVYRRSNGTITYADSITWSYSAIGSYGNAPVDQWNHIVVTFDGADIRFYINGALVHTQPRAGSLSDNTQPLCIGSYSCTGAFFNGRLDEVAIYDRVLPGPEVLAHYKRGIMNLRAQVRSDDDDASWGNFVGPDGTNATYFTDPLGEALNVPDNRYFQYKMYMNSEDTAQTPVLNAVNIDDSGYASDLPTVVPTNAEEFGKLNTFVETATKNGGQIYYQLSNDAGTGWLYWDGIDWSPAGAGDYNESSEVNTNIQNFPAGDFLFQAFLESDGSQHVILQDITVGSEPVPTGTINDVQQSSDLDLSSSNVSQTSANGDAAVSIDVFDPNALPCRAKIEWSTDGITYFPATLAEPVECDYFDLEWCPDIDDSEEYQLGQAPTKRIVTSAGSNTVDFIWESRTDIPEFAGDAFVRLTANNWTADQTTPAVFTASIDNLAPQGLSNFKIASATYTSLSTRWTPATQENNFDHYEIWYGQDLDVVRTRSSPAFMLNQSEKPELANMATSEITIDDVIPGALYFAKIFAFDRYGNIATTDGDGAVAEPTGSSGNSNCILSLVPIAPSSGTIPLLAIAIAISILVASRSILKKRRW